MKNTRSFASLLMLGSLLHGCGSVPDQKSQTSIYQGHATNEHPAVGRLISDGKLWCTATLITPSVALSAGHCFDGKSAKPASLFLEFNQGSIRTQVLDVIVHPKYSDYFGRVTSDLAVLKLANEPGLAPMALATTAPYQGEPVLFVGHGYTDSLAKDSFDGTKRQGTNVVGTIEAKKLFFPKPQDAQTSQVCRGDSGGPVFAARRGTLQIIAIVSGSQEGAASTTCRIESYGARVDAYGDWIRAQL